MRTVLEILTNAKAGLRRYRYDIPDAMAWAAPASARNLLEAFRLLHEATGYWDSDMREWANGKNREEIEQAFDDALELVKG